MFVVDMHWSVDGSYLNEIIRRFEKYVCVFRAPVDQDIYIN